MKSCSFQSLKVYLDFLKFTRRIVPKDFQLLKQRELKYSEGKWTKKFGIFNIKNSVLFMSTFIKPDFLQITSNNISHSNYIRYRKIFDCYAKVKNISEKLRRSFGQSFSFIIQMKDIYE